MTEREKCCVYIDESGDLGFNRGTHWFCMSAVVVKNADEKSIRDNIKKIKEHLNLNYIHFVKIKDFNRRAFLVNSISKETFTIISVVVDTRILSIAQKSTLFAYNYVSRFLIERVSWYLRDNNLIGPIVFSARSSKKDESLVSYVKRLLDSNNQICSSVITDVSYKKAEDWDMLQLADVCASSVFHMHEPDNYGLRYPCFYYRLRNHFYRYGDKLIPYGLKYYPDDADIDGIAAIPTPCGLKKRQKAKDA